MTTKTFICLLACLMILPGCKTTVQDGPTKVTVQNGGSGGDFCPPGQAKKGNC